MPNRFQTPGLRKQYDVCVKMYKERERTLFYPDGNRCVGSSIASYFWRGFDGVQLNWDAASRQWFAYAAYRAGEDMKKDDDKALEKAKAEMWAGSSVPTFDGRGDAY